MIRGWYHNSKNGQRLLTLDEIAEACCISSKEVKGWFADKIQKPKLTAPDLVDAAEVVWFLVKNSIPVATQLLPPKTRKILFITNDEYELHHKCDKFDKICRLLSGNCNILVETSTAGRLADLSILTFSPNLVVIFVKQYNQETVKTFNLLTNFPELKTIFFVDGTVTSDVERDLGTLSTHHFILSDTQPFEQLIPKLSMVFDN